VRSTGSPYASNLTEEESCLFNRISLSKQPHGRKALFVQQDRLMQATSRKKSPVRSTGSPYENNLTEETSCVFNRISLSWLPHGRKVLCVQQDLLMQATSRKKSPVCSTGSPYVSNLKEEKSCAFNRIALSTQPHGRIVLCVQQDLLKQATSRKNSPMRSTGSP
jgi:hypothetical protein